MHLKLSIVGLTLAFLASGCEAGGDQPVGVTAGSLVVAQTSTSAGDETEKLLGLTQEWVKAWEEKDVDRMQQLHGDDLTYGIQGDFIPGAVLINQLRKNNFWGLSWTLKVVEPRVRVLTADTALVLFRLVGKETGPKGSRPYQSIFTLVFQKRNGEWKIIHVHDSPAAGAG